MSIVDESPSEWDSESEVPANEDTPLMVPPPGIWRGERGLAVDSEVSVPTVEYCVPSCSREFLIDMVRPQTEAHECGLSEESSNTEDGGGRSDDKKLPAIAPSISRVDDDFMSPLRFSSHLVSDIVLPSVPEAR